MFILPDLPYGYGALAPVISDRTMHFHHDKHHATYVETTNKLLGAKGGPSPHALEAVVRDAAAGGDKKLYNNAAQAWNHGFFWEAMRPDAGKPSGELEKAIRGAFGDLAGLKTKFVEEGAGRFGSGWVWLASDPDGRLQVISTHDADDTITREGVIPLTVCDLWEHAYYLDHQNNRKGYLEVWFDRLPNWQLAALQHQAALGAGSAWRYPGPEAGLATAAAAAG